MKRSQEELHELITGYIDGELSVDQTQEVEKLLAGSKELYDYYLSEKRMKEVIKNQLGAVRAPSHLRTRVRRQIARTGYRPGFFELVQGLFDYRPLATSIAFAVIAVLILTPTYRMIVEGHGFVTKPQASQPTVRTASLEGEIICLDCDVFNPHLRTAEGHNPIVHRPGLKGDDGAIWTILGSGKGLTPQYAQTLLRKRATLHGLIFDNPRYIQVDSFELL